MDDKIYDIAGKKFSGNKLSSKERVDLDNWLNDDPKNKSLYDELEKTWSISNKFESKLSANIDNEWEKFKTLKNAPSLKPKSRTIIFKRVANIAASIILIVGISIVLIKNTNSEITLVANSETASYILPDSSIVYLNKNSSIQYNKRSFNKKDRLVKLDGEAYFEVTKSGKTFIVNTNKHILTRVLGTSFNIRSYKNENYVSLNVFEGKVAFESTQSDEKQILKEKEAAIFSTDKKSIKKVPFDINLFAWKTEKLSFNNDELSKVIPILEEHYNITIEIPENCDSLRFSAKFKNASVHEVAEVISLSFSWNYVINNRLLKFDIKN